MKKILAMSASNSSTSINNKLAHFIASQVEDVEVISFDWTDYELPLFSKQLEDEIGTLGKAQTFLDLIKSVDGIVLSLAEHNSMPTAAFKNLWDWTSRIEVKFWSQKPMFLSATSPGKRGGTSVLGIISNAIPHYGADLVETFSLPKFNDNFKDGAIADSEKTEELNEKLKAFKEKVFQKVEAE